LDTYSIMKEYLGVENQFWRDTWHHLALSVTTLLASVVVGLPLGYWCIRNSFTDKIVLTGLNITETIPIMALFAVLRIPFSALGNHFVSLKQLGIGGYGIAPAFGALFLYALYLIIHNVRAAFLSIDENLIENAYAMGMTSRGVFWKVRIPMALPIILTGIRIAFISTLIGAALASYVGGGGLGVYIVNGINSLAIDMMLLGVIPIFVMTIVADYLLRLLINHSFPKRGMAGHDFVAGSM
jgi:osmoprotectant transport system permease protein